MFPGPCVLANAKLTTISTDTTPDQQKMFDNYTSNYQSGAGTFTSQRFVQGVDSSGRIPAFLVLLAFNPTADPGYVLNGNVFNKYNNWKPNLNGTGNFTSGTQFWLQTAERSIICYAVNASFDVGFNYTNGVGSITYQDVKVLTSDKNNPNITLPNGALNLGSSGCANLHAAEIVTKNLARASQATFLSLTNIINGNVSLVNSSSGCIDCDSPLLIQEANSRALQTGLIACDDIAHNYCYRNYGFVNNFPSEPWMCRNRTLDRAIEDLANNITISMLSVANFTKNATVPMRILTIENVYSYNSQNLFISYGIVILVTVAAVAVGLMSLVQNGVYHDTSFSAFMATTRNRDLDALAEGSCLGSSQGLEKERLMFGVLDGQKEGGYVGGVVKEQHAAFGLPGTVVRLRKGTPCS